MGRRRQRQACRSPPAARSVDADAGTTPRRVAATHTRAALAAARGNAARPQTRSKLRGNLLTLRSIARRAPQLPDERPQLAPEIEGLTRKLAPQLLDQSGVIRSEAAFARLAGAAPLAASSGQTIRYRLDRSGDRKLNRALHMLLVTRRRTHPATIAYIQRR